MTPIIRRVSLINCLPTIFNNRLIEIIDEHRDKKKTPGVKNIFLI